MLLLKVYYHINATIKKLAFKILFAKKISIHPTVTFRSGFKLMVEGSGHIHLNKNTFFNNNCSITAVNETIEIGEGSLFGEGVKIYTHNHCYKQTQIPIKEQGYRSAPVKIGKHCWIASNVVILKGVTIGDNSVIGAGCIIYKDIPANTIVINKQDLSYQSY